jgi:hypothetical protein
VDDVKTDGSRRLMTLDQELLAILRTWKESSQFVAETDWIFASPLKLGHLPYSYTGFWRELQRAAVPRARRAWTLGRHVRGVWKEGQRSMG